MLTWASGRLVGKPSLTGLRKGYPCQPATIREYGELPACEGDGNLRPDGPFHGSLNGSQDLRSGLSPCLPGGLTLGAAQHAWVLGSVRSVAIPPAYLNVLPRSVETFSPSQTTQLNMAVPLPPFVRGLHSAS